MTNGILERAKEYQEAHRVGDRAGDVEPSKIIDELIAEVEAQRAEVERLRSDLLEHLYVNATPDGGYAMRILQGYRGCCDVYVSDSTTGGPTNPLYIAMNEANEKRKIELDRAISDLANATAKDTRIKELEADRRRLEARVEFCHNQQKLIDRLEAEFLESMKSEKRAWSGSRMQNEECPECAK